MGDDMKAYGAVHAAGIKQSYAGTLQLNQKMTVLGKNTKDWNKLIAINNQVYRNNAKQTGFLVHAMIDNTLKAALDTDRLGSVLTGLTSTLDTLAVTLGLGVPLMAKQAISEMGATLNNQSFGDIASKVTSFFMNPANAASLLRLTGGQMDLQSVGGWKDLIRTIAKSAFDLSQANNGVGGDFQKMHFGQKFMSAVGGTGVFDAALLHNMITNPIPKGPGNGGLDDLAKQMARDDLFRSLSILFNSLAQSLRPVTLALTRMVTDNVIPFLHNAISMLATTLTQFSNWLGEKFPDLVQGSSLQHPETPAQKVALVNLQGTSNAFNDADVVNQIATDYPAADERARDIQKTGNQMDVVGAGAGSIGTSLLVRGQVSKYATQWFTNGINSGNIGNMFNNAGKGIVNITDKLLAKKLGIKFEKHTTMLIDDFILALQKSGIGRLMTQELLEQVGFKGSPKVLKTILDATKKQSAWAISKALGVFGAKTLAAKQALVATAGPLMGYAEVLAWLHTGYQIADLGADLIWPDSNFFMTQAASPQEKTVGGAMQLAGDVTHDNINFVAELLTGVAGDKSDILEVIWSDVKAMRQQSLPNPNDVPIPLIYNGAGTWRTR